MDSLTVAYTPQMTKALHWVIGHMMAAEVGMVVLEREPGSDHGWLEVFPAGPGPRFAIWKATGAVHSMAGAAGPVSDDPVFLP